MEPHTIRRVASKGPVCMAKKAIRRSASPAMMGLVKVMGNTRHGSPRREMQPMREPCETQTIRPAIRHDRQRAALAVLPPGLSKAAQTSGIHGEMGAVSMQE